MEMTLYVIYEEVSDFLSEDYRINDIIYFSLDKRQRKKCLTSSKGILKTVRFI